MKDTRIKTFYTPKQVLEHDATENFSQSPPKPRLLMEYLAGQGLAGDFEVAGAFPPFTDEDFRVVHAAEYVDAFFAGRQPLGFPGNRVSRGYHMIAGLFSLMLIGLASMQSIWESGASTPSTPGIHRPEPKAANVVDIFIQRVRHERCTCRRDIVALIGCLVGPEGVHTPLHFWTQSKLDPSLLKRVSEKLLGSSRT